MTRILGTGISLPPYRITQEEAGKFAALYFKRNMAHMDRVLTVFDHAQIDQRYLCVPFAWYEDENGHSFTERSAIYVREATLLAQDALTAALHDAGLQPHDVDTLIMVSSTGIAAPSLDARIMNALGMRSDVRRVPIWGLGCAGGVAGLARAAELCRAYPDSVTAIVAVETCSLTFQFGDFSKKNFVATALFGDGAAAAILAGDAREPERDAPQIMGSYSTLWPDSLRVMGWDVVETGLDVLFGVEIPRYVADLLRPEVDCFLGKHGLKLDQIRHMVLHPGGAKVIDSYREALAASEEQLIPARHILRQYGNMSSPTVLFVLDYLLKSDEERPQPGEYALSAALGPGFSAEQVLIRF